MNIKYLPLTRFVSLSDSYPGEWVRYIDLNKNNLEYEDFSESLIKYILNYKFIEIEEAAERKNAEIELDELLEKFKSWELYKSLEKYIDAVEELYKRVEKINLLQDEIILDIEAGLKVKGLVYTKSEELLNYISKESLLKNAFNEVGKDSFKDVDMLLIEIKSLESLLEALLICDLAKKQNVNIYISLIDSNFENFTFSNFSKELKEDHEIFKFFNSVIRYKNQKDIIVPELVANLENGIRKNGYLELENGDFQDNKILNSFIIPKKGILSPDNIINIELKNKKCDWNRCNFCTHSNKYSDIYKEEKFKERAKRIITHVVESGFRYMNFSDSGLGVEELETICDILIEKDVDVKWCCRCRTDTQFSEELIRMMKQAGCREILFGVESFSERVLNRMNKHNKIPTFDHIQEMFNMISHQGINIHVTLICGYPGEREEDVLDTMKKIFWLLRNTSNSAIWMNKISVFNNTELSRNPEKYGIRLHEAPEDFAAVKQFHYVDSEYKDNGKLDELYVNCHYWIYEFLGWKEAITKGHVRSAMLNFFHTCQGFFVKQNIELFTALNDMNAKEA